MNDKLVKVGAEPTDTAELFCLAAMFGAQAGAWFVPGYDGTRLSDLLRSVANELSTPPTHQDALQVAPSDELQSLAGFIKRLADSFRGGELVELFASRADKLDRVAEILSAQVAPVEPTADVADIIAGSLQTSRSHAYELMRNAVIEQDEYFASSTTPQVEPTRAALEEFEEHLRNFATSDDKGIVEPKEPFSWETLARVAIDLARAALKNGESVPPLSGAALDAAVAKASRDSLVKLKDR